MVTKEQIKKYDRSSMIDSLRLFPEQIREIKTLSTKVRIPANYRKLKNIVVSGMGGSALPARIAISLYRDRLSVPVIISDDYSLPGFVNRDTVVILSSYSGNTEEVLSASVSAKKRGARVLVIAAGGDLQKMHDHGTPGLIFTTASNPCHSPRMGLGYGLFALLAVLDKLGVVTITEREWKGAINAADKYSTLYAPESIDNPAMALAEKMSNRAVLIVAGEHLAGNARVAANQVNENNKRFAVPFVIPEMNHHLLEGLKLPATNSKNLLVWFLNSNQYTKRVSKRVQITRSIMLSQHLPVVEYLGGEREMLAEVAEVLVLTSWVAYYGAIFSKLDPTPVSYVDYLKAELAK